MKQGYSKEVFLMNMMNKSMEAVGQNNFVRILKGSIVAIVITLIILFIFALLLAYTNMSETMITPVVIVASSISILIGSILSSRKIRKQGLINGGFVGLIYVITIYLLSSMIQKDFGINTYTIIMIVACILAGCLGGIIGVNQKRS